MQMLPIVMKIALFNVLLTTGIYYLVVGSLEELPLS